MITYLYTVYILVNESLLDILMDLGNPARLTTSAETNRYTRNSLCALEPYIAWATRSKPVIFMYFWLKTLCTQCARTIYSTHTLFLNCVDI